MKLWIKYAVGIILGLLLYFVLPAEAAAENGIIPILSDFSMRIAGYVILPLIFFTLPVAVCELFDEERFWRGIGGTALVFAAGVLGATALGMGAGLAFSPLRIPLLADVASEPALGLADFFRSLFPYNITRVFSDPQGTIFPLSFLALILGVAFSHDRIAAKPLFSLFDSASRVSFQIATFIAEIMGAVLIPATTAAAFKVGGILAGDLYGKVLLLIMAESALAALVILPLALWIMDGKRNPYPSLFAFFGPALAALAMGDIRPAATLLYKHGRENLGISRKTDGLALPLGISIGRAGTAMVTASAFVAVLSSYTGLGITWPRLLLLLAVVPAATFMAGSTQGPGNLAALAVTCALFGRGFENGYLVLMPLAFPLAMAGTFLDSLWIGAVTLVRARKDGKSEEKPARHHV